MRIFYAADHATNSALSGSRLWYINLFLPLVDLGHEVIPFEYDMGPHASNLDPSDPRQAEFIEEHRPRLERALLDQVQAVHRDRPIDLFFSYFYSAHCTPSTIEAVRSLGIKTINWYCNASYQFHLVRDLAPAYDACLVPEQFRLEDYREIGANPIYCQEAANPNFYKPISLEKDLDISFVGQRYGDRPHFIRTLVAAGLRVHVFGPHWARSEGRAPKPIRRLLGSLGLGRWLEPEGIAGPMLSDDDMVRLHSRSRISLGLSSCGETHAGEERILQVRLRDFEAPMCRAFYMVEWMPELSQFFEPDKEVVFYRDAEDLADKARFYLRRPELRNEIAEAGYRRALAEHTWHKRLADAFEAAGLPGRGEGAPGPQVQL